ncbi:MAG: zinc ribbon domain-containing protein [Gemmatimonadota bacterium]|jgi:putative FmdB family regulatory protein
MPTYEYRCPEGHTFEVFQKMSDEPVAECPECGKPAERILSGGAGFLFKGEGFYITDYRSEEYRKKAAAEGGAEPGKSEGGAGKKPGEAGKGSEGGGESKAAAKKKKKESD